MPSFDIASSVDVQVLDNAVNVVKKEITNRFDFKGIHVVIDLNKKNSYNKASSECMYGRNLCTNENVRINFYEKNGYKFFTKI